MRLLAWAATAVCVRALQVDDAPPFGDLSPEAQLRELRATLSGEDRALMEAALSGAKAMGDDYLFGGRPDEGNDERLWREARQGLEWRLRTRGVKRGEKAPRAVVQEAYADYVRGFMESNPGCEGTMEVVFEGIFAGFVLVLKDEAALCKALLFAVGAGDCWPRIVEAGLDDPRKLLSRFDNELEALGIPPDAFPRLRGGLGCYRDQ